MLEIIREGKYGFLILAILLIVTVIVWYKAISASQKRNKILNAEMGKLKHYNMLKKAYETIEEQLLLNAPEEQLFEGIAIHIQSELEKNQDMNAAFNCLTDGEQYIYTLYYLLEDSTEKLSNFFRNNGHPLTTLAPQALQAVGTEKLAEIARQEQEMLDENNETVSVDYTVLEKLDKDFNKMFDMNEFKILVSKYIRKNKEYFLR